MQTTINQRVKFLLENFDLSARAFGKVIGVGENTTQNYLEPRLAQPRADYLERIVLHFASINPDWLLTGRGEPFLPGVAPSPVITQKKNKGTTVGVNHGGITTQPQAGGTDCERELAMAQQTIALLSSQLQDKERLIRLYERQTPTTS